MDVHRELITLIIAYTCVGVFAATALASVLDIFNVFKLAPDIRTRLYATLIFEIVAIGVGTFGGFLRLNPQPITKEFEALQKETGNLENELLEKTVRELLTASKNGKYEDALKVADREHAVDILFSESLLGVMKTVNSENLTCEPSGTDQYGCQVTYSNGVLAFRLRKTDSGWWVEEVKKFDD